MTDRLENLLQRDAHFLRSSSDRYQQLRPVEQVATRKGRFIFASLLSLTCAITVAIMVWPNSSRKVEVTAASQADMDELREINADAADLFRRFASKKRVEPKPETKFSKCLERDREIVRRFLTAFSEVGRRSLNRSLEADEDDETSG